MSAIDSSEIRRVLEASWPNDLPIFPAQMLAVREASTVQATDLHPEELKWCARFSSAKREKEFLTGRALARADLTPKYLNPETPLLPNEDGAPNWPKGVLAALSHSGGFVFFAAAEQSEIPFLGIDLQEVRPVSTGLIKYVASSEEERAYAHSTERLLTLFSAKEAVYKAIYRDYNFQFMPRRIQLTPLEDGTFRLAQFPSEGASIPAITVVSVTQNNLIFSLAG